MMESDDVELTLQDAYKEFMALTSARFLLTAGFLEDVRNITSALSLLCQRDCILPSDINAKHEATPNPRTLTLTLTSPKAVQVQLRALTDMAGLSEMEVHRNYMPETQTYLGLAIPNWDEDNLLFERDREKYLGLLSKAFQDRIPLKEGVHLWVSVILGRRDWPMDPNVDEEGP